MEKKIYSFPELEIYLFEVNDIVTNSFVNDFEDDWYGDEDWRKEGTENA